ncbi:MAG: SDR family oxidoreductase [Thermoanaerobaculia bacterium]
MKGIVCGASRGIGFGISKILVEKKHRVLIVSRSEENLKIASRKLKNCKYIKADLNEEKEREKLISESLKILRKIDFLIINTGGPPSGNFFSAELEQYDYGYNSLLKSTIHLTKLTVDHFIKNKFGRYIIISSIAAREPIKDLILSNTFRSALFGFVKTFSKEVAKYNITCNIILPGYVNTERIKELAEKRGGFEKFKEEIIKDVPVGRLIEPEEIGHLVNFLISKEANSITGTSIPVDGGFLKSIP